MNERPLGTAGLRVSALGLGCMGISAAYGTPDPEQGIATIHRALELGITFFDTAEVYGPYTNEELLGRALHGRSERVAVATKFGFKIEDGGPRGLDGSPRNVARAAEASLRRLNRDVIDLFYQHRRDPDVPIEETVGAMAELVAQGKVRYLGLSEVGPETLRRAHAVHPISALQSEYSLWERGIEERILPLLRELGIGLVPFSPLGRGFLTGALDVASLGEKDFRRNNPRFSAENARRNAALVDRVRAVAERHRATPAQIALAWVLDRGDDVVPIPGTKRVAYLEQNAASVDIVLTDDDRRDLDTIAGQTSGDRYVAEQMRQVER
jgi:aryl-alcohol dehydrogenase-like predicted oxidoreductase